MLPYPTASVGSPRRFARQGVVSPPPIGLHGACPSLGPTWPCTGTSVAQMPKDSQGFRKPLWGKLGGEVRREVPSFPCPGGDERPGQAPAPAAGPLCQVPPHLHQTKGSFASFPGAHLFSQNYFRHDRSSQPATRRPTTIACWTDGEPKKIFSNPPPFSSSLWADGSTTSRPSLPPDPFAQSKRSLDDCWANKRSRAAASKKGIPRGFEPSPNPHTPISLFLQEPPSCQRCAEPLSKYHPRRRGRPWPSCRYRA